MGWLAVLVLALEVGLLVLVSRVYRQPPQDEDQEDDEEEGDE